MFCTDTLSMLTQLPGWSARRLFGRRTITFLRHREALGDTVEMSALVRGLKLVLPEYKIAVVTRRPEVFESNPNVDEVYGWHLLRVPRTVRATYNGKDMARDEHVVRIQWSRLWAELRKLGIAKAAHDPELASVDPDVVLTSDEREWGRRELAARSKGNRPIVLISSTGKTKPVHNREWGAENFQQVCDALAPFCTLIQVGGEQTLLSNGSPLPQMVGLPVRKVASLFTACDAFVTQEGGLMHLATGVKAPIVTIFGASLLPSQTGYERNINFWSRPECSPCFGTGINCYHLKCMVDITPRRVVGGIAEMLQRSGKSLPAEALEAAPGEWTPPSFVDRKLLAEVRARV